MQRQTPWKVLIAALDIHVAILKARVSKIFDTSNIHVQSLTQG